MATELEHDPQSRHGAQQWSLSSGAQVLVTGKTFVAFETAMSEPAKSDALSDF